MFESLFEKQKYTRIIFFDTETTGFEPDKDDQIIELAALSVTSDGEEGSIDEFISLEVKPELPSKITELTGITGFDLAMKGISEKDAMEKFINLAFPWIDPKNLFERLDRRTLLVAHNAQFDLLFMAYALIRQRDKGNGKGWEKPGGTNWLNEFSNADYLDTLTVYRDRHSFPHKLQNAIEYYGLADKVQNTHRAIDDCHALYEVTKAMDAERDDLAGYINLFGYPRKYGVSGKKFKKVTYLEQEYTNYSGKTLPEQLARRSQ